MSPCRIVQVAALRHQAAASACVHASAQAQDASARSRLTTSGNRLAGILAKQRITTSSTSSGTKFTCPSFGATHGVAGREAVFLLLLTTIVSDTAQFYSGRLFGRHKLSPSVSPGKTVEGAAGGFLVTPLVMAVVSRWWLPAARARAFQRRS